jgi:hypothetical protein
MAITPTKDSPRPRAVVDPGAVKWLEGIEEAVDLFGRDHRPGVHGGDDGLSPSSWAEICTPAAGQAPASPAAVRKLPNLRRIVFSLGESRAAIHSLAVGTCP